MIMKNKLKYYFNHGISSDSSNSETIFIFHLSGLINMKNFEVPLIDGRLGNSLFMFASAYGLSRLHRCSLHIGESFKKELNEIFELNLTNEIS
jgi:hypothetical protein